ncbi:MAG TPA: hypothetical protein VK169_14695 [Saprospiraceae bacterium]|nr:hypothetical protein [Saprospiraceae bacterium]
MISQCTNLTETSYLRSNLCGHETGNIYVKMKDIWKEELIKILDVVMMIVQGEK